MEKAKIVDTNAGNLYDYKICGYKNIKQEGYKRKTEWLKKRFSEGLKFKVLHSPTDGVVGSIEYIPGEYTWRAVDAKGYMVIHCIFIEKRKYREQGYGTLLVEESIKDAKTRKMHGVAAVTRKGTWMVGKDLFLKMGFEVTDTAPPDFELLVMKFNRNEPSPKFKGDWDKKIKKYSKGLTIITSDQCPYIAKFMNEMPPTAKKYGKKPRIIELKTCKDAQDAPSAFATFGMVYKGKLVADHPISNKRFMNIMDKEK